MSFDRPVATSVNYKSGLGEIWTCASGHRPIFQTCFPEEISSHLGLKVKHTIFGKVAQFLCGNLRICKWCMLPVSAREFHDLGVEETNFGELPIIMGCCVRKLQPKMVKALPKLLQRSVIGEAERSLSICPVLTIFSFEIVACHLSTCLTSFQHQISHKLQMKIRFLTWTKRHFEYLQYKS